jgi:adenine deaminase
MKYIITLCTFCFSALVIYAQDSASTIINNTNVIDVRNGKIRPGMSVIIKNETIVDVIPSGKLKPDPTARLIEGKGKYVMPGMVDGQGNM